MSLISGPIDESEQAGEKLADHVTDRVGKDLPAVFCAVLDILCEYAVTVTVRLEKRSQ